MPVLKCPNGKWRIGDGECIYDTKEKAESAYRGYLASKAQAFSSDKQFDESKLREKLEKEKKK